MNPIRASTIKPFEDMDDVWQGADYEFVDPGVQAAFEPVMPGVHRLADLSVNRTFEMDDHPAFRTVKNDEVLRTKRRAQWTLDAAKAMNQTATDLSRAIDDFLRIARAKIVV